MLAAKFALRAVTREMKAVLRQAHPLQNKSQPFSSFCQIGQSVSLCAFASSLSLCFEQLWQIALKCLINHTVLDDCVRGA